MLKAKYRDLNAKVERMSRFFHFILTKLTVAGFMTSSVIITFRDYYINDLGNEAFYLAIPAQYVWINLIKIQYHFNTLFTLIHSQSFPINSNTPLGFFLGFIITCVSMYTICVSVLPSICLTFGCYWLDQTIVKDIISDYRILNDKVSDINQIEVLELFYKIIEDISNAKQLSDRSF